MKYRKKPVIVEAVQWFKHGDHQEVHPMPNDGQVYPALLTENGYIQTLEGIMQVRPGDWIITGVQGEHYPCKPDIFEMTYEEVNE